MREFLLPYVDAKCGRTWRQRTGVKTLSHPPTLLACFIIRASFETVKVLVTHGRTQKTHGENIITETLMAVPNTLTQQRRCYHATGHLQQTDNRPIWRHRHVNVPTKHADTTAVQHRQHHGNTAVIPRSFKMNNMEYICTKCFENFATEHEYNFHWENNHPVDCEMEMLSLWNGFRKALWTLCP